MSADPSAGSREQQGRRVEPADSERYLDMSHRQKHRPGYCLGENKCVSLLKALVGSCDLRQCHLSKRLNIQMDNDNRPHTEGEPTLPTTSVATDYKQPAFNQWLPVSPILTLFPTGDQTEKVKSAALTNCIGHPSSLAHPQLPRPTASNKTIDGWSLSVFH